MNYSSRHVQSLFDISSETVRQWATEFARHLSANANPGEGRHRQFTEDDMRVFSLISQMKSDNLTFADIQASLDSGQLGDVPDIPADELQIMLATEQGRQLAKQIEGLQSMLGQLREERDSLLPLRDENIRLKSDVENRDTQIGDLNTKLEKANKRIEDLNREVIESYYKGKMEKPDGSSES